MVEAVLFDVDGTLVDSVDLHAQAWQDAFAHYGKQIPFLSIREQIGKGGDQIIDGFLTPQEVERFGDELAEHRSNHYLETYMPRVRAFPKAHELLSAVRSRGIKVALATSAQEKELEQLKNLIQADGVVDEYVDKDQVGRSKPFPDIFAKALDKLGVAPARAVVVGDSPYDAEAASKLSIRTVGLLCGGFSAQSLMDAGCEALYKDPDDLLQSLDYSFIASRSRSRGAKLV